MPTPHHRDASSGCFAAIFRRMLCKAGLPTHPSDDISERNPTEAKPTLQAPATPGVVARLMGLESLPGTSLNRVPNGPGSVRRSRSVNFTDHLLKLDLADQPAQQFHRRVRSSVSFRQLSVTASSQPNKVFVLYLDNAGEKKKARSKQRKPEAGSLKSKQSRHARSKAVVKKDKVSKLKDEPRRVSVPRNKNQIYGKKAKSPTKLVNQKEALIELEPTRKKRNHRKVKKTEHDPFSSVDLSPVSVLDLDLGDFSINHDRAQFPEEAILYGKMKPTLKFSENDAGFQNHETENLMEIRSKLCRSAEEDIGDSNWSSKDEIEDMCVEFGDQILNQLLQQVVDETVLMPI